MTQSFTDKEYLRLTERENRLAGQVASQQFTILG
jgi:hypothetical protein